MPRVILTLCLTLFAFVVGARADGDGTEAEKADVAAATTAWVEAFNARDPERIAALYAPDAVFWGTISKTIRTTPAAVLEYFRDSTTLRPRLRMTLVDQHTRVFGDIGINTGAYTSRDIRDGQEIVNPSRFTFVYRRIEGRWMIIEHHSSRVPQ
jgi:uncharacterized protein (TIGR02246 family)